MAKILDTYQKFAVGYPVEAWRNMAGSLSYSMISDEPTYLPEGAQEYICDLAGFPKDADELIRIGGKLYAGIQA